MASMWDTLVQTVKQHMGNPVSSPYFQNLAHNAYQGVADAASAAGHAIAHPVETAEAVPSAVKHAYQKIDQFAGGAGQAAVHALGLPQNPNTPDAGTPEQNAADEQSFHDTVNQYKKNYGSWKGFTQHLENHPWQVLNDALMVAGPAGAAVGKLGEAAKIAKVAATADDLDEAFGHVPVGQRQSLVSPTSGVEPSGSVKPISTDHLDRIFAHADVAPEAEDPCFFTI